MAKLVMSKSRLGQFLMCPMSYYLSHIAHAPGYASYPAFLGQEVHAFIANLYKGTRTSDRPFFYKSIESAKGAWFYRWNTNLAKLSKPIRFPSKKTADQYGVTGWICINNYWKQNFDKPKPLYIEKRVTLPLKAGVSFVGIFDQIRAATPESIAQFRPDLLDKKGNLVKGYDPVYLVDLKTNKYGYDVRGYKPDASDLEIAAGQFQLHEDIQATAYHWLYWRWTGKLPLGFFWYHLRSGKYYLTTRTKADFAGFIE